VDWGKAVETGAAPPGALAAVVDPVADAYAGTALLALGMQVARIRLSTLRSDAPQVLALSAGKLLVTPAAGRGPFHCLPVTVCS